MRYLCILHMIEGTARHEELRAGVRTENHAEDLNRKTSQSDIDLTLQRFCFFTASIDQRRGTKAGTEATGKIGLIGKTAG